MLLYITSKPGKDVRYIFLKRHIGIANHIPGKDFMEMAQNHYFVAHGNRTKEV